MRQLCVGVRRSTNSSGSLHKQVDGRHALSSSCRSRREGRLYSTRAHRLDTQKFDAPGAVVGPAPFRALDGGYDEASNPTALLEQDIKTLLEARIPIQKLTELGNAKLSGRALMQWQKHVKALELKMNSYAKELLIDLSVYQLADSQVRNFPSWSMAVRELFRTARAVQEKEERYRRDAAGLSLDGSKPLSAAGTIGSAANALNSNVKDALDNFGSGISFDELGFPLLGMDWETALANRKGEFHWTDQPVVIIAIKNLRAALQPPTSAAGSKKNSLLTVLDTTPTAVYLERMLVIDFQRRKLILSERVERGDAGADYDPSVRHAEAWQGTLAKINNLFDAPKPDTPVAPAAEQLDAAKAAPSPLTPSNAPSALVASILAEGDRLKKPIQESIERLLESLREEIRVVEQLAINADTGAHVPAALPMTIPDLEALIHRIRTHTISQSRLTASAITDRAIGGTMTGAAAGRTIARPTAVTVGVPATLTPEAQRQLDDLKTQMTQLLEVLATKVGVTAEAIDRRSVRDAEAGIVTGAKSSVGADSVESAGLPPWRQRVYTIPPNLLLSLKQVQWPRSQYEAYEYDRTPIRKFGRDGLIAVGVHNHWTDHFQQLRKSLGPDIADISQMAAITEAAAAAAAAIAGRPAASASSSTAVAAAAPAAAAPAQS